MQWSRIRIIVGLALALLGLYLVPSGGGSVLALDPVAAADELLALTNISRTSNGLAALPRDGALASVAVIRSQDMIVRAYFSHYIPPDNHTVANILNEQQVRWRAVGENIEWNNAQEFMTVQYAANDFMNSPHHRTNVLDSRWLQLAVGVAEGPDRRMYTVLFLKPPSTPAPSP